MNINVIVNELQKNISILSKIETICKLKNYTFEYRYDYQNQQNKENYCGEYFNSFFDLYNYINNIYIKNIKIISYKKDCEKFKVININVVEHYIEIEINYNSNYIINQLIYNHINYHIKTFKEASKINMCDKYLSYILKIYINDSLVNI